MAERDTTFDHPVYQKLSRINGQINKMSKSDLKKRLSELNLNDRGVIEVLRKRLKNWNKRHNLSKSGVSPPKNHVTQFDYLLVIDFEATCEEGATDYNHEIIEFPIIMVDVKKQLVVDEFCEYVRPCVNKKLSKFCINLTGITQEIVDASDEFTAVLGRATSWMRKHGLFGGRRFVVVTDGPFDMGRFMMNQCCVSGIDHPPWARKWVNLRKIFTNSYLLRRTDLSNMLKSLELTFEGRPHCGRDDARNLARISIQLLKDGGVFKTNEYLQVSNNSKSWSSTENDSCEPNADETNPQETSSTSVKCQKMDCAASSNKVKKLKALERSLDILAEDRDNGASPDDIDMLRNFCGLKL